SHAVQSYASDKGRLPIEANRDPLDILVGDKYMKYKPLGGASEWALNGSSQSLLTPVKGEINKATKICVAARVKAEMPNPETIFKCDGSDAPDGALSPKDPCCLI